MRPPRLETLDNGLRVLTDPDAAAPIVGIALYYDVGSKDEEPGRSGFAHLFEHLMFEGSEHVGKTEHFQLVQGFGGQLNATTSQDRTNYYESLPAHQLALGLWLEADRMRALQVTPENFENQRQTVMEERRQRIDDAPYGLAQLAFSELSYTCWPYAHPIIGSWEDLRAASHADVVDFHRKWYRPDNAVLAIAGDFDEDEALDLVGAYFGAIAPGGRQPRAPLHEPPRAGPRIEELRAPLAQLPALFVSHLAPPHDDPDFFVYEIIESLLLAGPSSRLYRRLVVDEALAVDVNGGYEVRRGPSLFSLYAVAARGAALSRIYEAYQSELDRLAREPVSARELQKVCNQLRASRLFSQESALYRAMAHGRSLLFTGDPAWENRYLERVTEVGAEDVMRVAARDLGSSLSVQLRVSPP